MPSCKHCGKHFLNPHLLRSHEANHEPAEKITVHRHDDGTYETVSHHAGGHRERAEHEDLNQVHDHLREKFQDEGPREVSDDRVIR